MKSKWIVIMLSIFVVVSSVVSSVISWNIDSRKLDSVTDVEIVGENMVIASNEQDFISIILADSKGKEIDSINVEKNNLICREILKDGENVYVHMTSYYRDNGISEVEKIMYCNFDKGRLEEKFTVNDKVKEFKVKNNKLYYVCETDKEVILNCMDTEISEIDRCPLDYRIAEYEITDSLKLTGYSAKDGVFVFSDGSAENIFPTENENCQIVSYDCFQNNIYFSDLVSCKDMTFNTQTSEYKSSDIKSGISIQGADEQIDIPFSDMKNISYNSESTFIAVCDAENKNKIAFCLNDTFTLFDELKLKPFKFITFFNYFSLVYTFFCTCVIIINLYKKKKNYISLCYKVALISVLIVFAGTSIIGKGIKKSDSIDAKYQNGISDIESVIKTGNVFDNELLYDLIADDKYSLYAVDVDENLVTVKDRDGVKNIPAEYTLRSKEIDRIYEYLEDGESSIIENSDFYTFIYPIDNTVMLTVNVEKYLFTISEHTEFISFLSKIFLILIVVLFILFFFKPIKNIVKQINNDTVRLAPSEKIFRDEIDEVKFSLEFMNSFVAEREKEIQLKNEKYKKFIPSEIFGIFRRNDISCMKAGNTRYMKFYNVYLSNIDEKILSKIISDIKKYDCIIDNFGSDFIEISFKDNPEICIKSITEKYKGICAGISYGESCVTISGAKERLQVAVISEHKEVAKILSENCSKFSTDILVSESFCDGKYLGKVSDINVYALSELSEKGVD